MKYSKKNVYNYRKLNNLNRIKKRNFGYMVSVPSQVLTKKYKKKCRNHIIYKSVTNFPRKKKKGYYLVMSPREKTLLKKKKTKRKICY